mgnify:CR=1 FL=1
MEPTSHTCEVIDRKDSVNIDGYGPAIEYCHGRDDGSLWAGNSEYGTRVNFCPFCGLKAPVGRVE